eukprot:8893186-Pyramimonas_sp.AAC.1
MAQGARVCPALLEPGAGSRFAEACTWQKVTFASASQFTYVTSTTDYWITPCISLFCNGRHQWCFGHNNRSPSILLIGKSVSG